MYQYRQYFIFCLRNAKKRQRGVRSSSEDLRFFNRPLFSVASQTKIVRWSVAHTLYQRWHNTEEPPVRASSLNCWKQACIAGLLQSKLGTQRWVTLFSSKMYLQELQKRKCQSDSKITLFIYTTHSQWYRMHSLQLDNMKESLPKKVKHMHINNIRQQLRGVNSTNLATPRINSYKTEMKKWHSTPFERPLNQTLATFSVCMFQSLVNNTNPGGDVWENYSIFSQGFRPHCACEEALLHNVVVRLGRSISHSTTKIPGPSTRYLPIIATRVIANMSYLGFKLKTISNKLSTFIETKARLKENYQSF